MSPACVITSGNVTAIPLFHGDQPTYEIALSSSKLKCKRSTDFVLLGFSLIIGSSGTNSLKMLLHQGQNFALNNSVVAEATNTLAKAVGGDATFKSVERTRGEIGFSIILPLWRVFQLVGRIEDVSEFRVSDCDFDLVDDVFHYIPNVVFFVGWVNRFFYFLFVVFFTTNGE